MSQLYIVECKACSKEQLFCSPYREAWICVDCGYDNNPSTGSAERKNK